MNDKIFHKDEAVLGNMKRKMLLDHPTKDFLTRLDLVDDYPELFKIGKKKSQEQIKLNLTDDEMEQLRILMRE